MALTRDELLVKYGGYPRRLADEIPGEVLVFAHSSLEEADDYADATNEHYGHPSQVRYRAEANEWHTVVDLRPALARIDKELNNG